MKTIIKIEIEFCEECPFSKTSKVYTPDSFENCRKVLCVQLKKLVYTCLDWNERSIVPKECPFNEQ